MAIKKRDEAIDEFNRKVNRLEREYKEVKGENTRIKGYLGVLSVSVIVLLILSAIVINLTGHTIMDFSSGSLVNVTSESSFSHVSVSGELPYSGGNYFVNICTGTPSCALNGDNSACVADWSGACIYNGATSGSCSGGTSESASCSKTGSCTLNGGSDGCAAGQGVTCTFNAAVGSFCDGGVSDCPQWNDDAATCSAHSEHCTLMSSGSCSGNTGCEGYTTPGDCSADAGMYGSCTWTSGVCSNSVSDCSSWNADLATCSNAGCTPHEATSASCVDNGYGCDYPNSDLCNSGGGVYGEGWCTWTVTTPACTCSGGDSMSCGSSCSSGCSWSDGSAPSCLGSPSCSGFNANQATCEGDYRAGICTLGQSEVTGKGLVGYYSFDGDGVNANTTIHDYFSNGYDGIVQGTASYVDGKYGKGIALANSYVDFTNSNVWTNGEITASFWIKTTNINGHWMGAGTCADCWRIEAGDNPYVVTDDIVTAQSSTNIRSGTWHHIAITISINGTVKWYTDGGLESTYQATHLVQSTQTFQLGRVGGDAAQNGDAIFDDLMIFDYALSSDQISAIYSGSSPRFGYLSGEHDFSVNLGTNTTANLTLGDYVIPSGTSIQGQISTGTADGSVVSFTNGAINDYALPSGDLTSATLKIIYNTDANRFLSPIAISNISVVSWDNASAPSGPAANSLIYHLKGEDNALDSSGNGYDGTWGGTPDYATGINGSAFSFSGSTYVQTANAGNYDLGTTNYSFSFWMNQAVDTPGTLGTPMHIGDSTPDFIIYSNIDGGSASALGCSVGNLAFYSQTLGTISICSSMSQDSWIHVVGTYDAATANVTLYINGNVVGSVLGTPSTATGTLRIVLGAQNADANYFKGKIDDFRFYNYALSAENVTTLYNEFNVPAADTIAPSVEIASPQQNANYGTRVIDLNYSAYDDVAVDKCWYSFDAGITMSPAQVCGINWTGLTALDEGNNRWTVYVNDTTGNTNSTDVFFYVDSLAPNIHFANPTSSGTMNGSSIYVNLTTSDANEHYSFLDLDRSLSLWYRMDNVNASGDPVDSSSYSLNGSKKASAVQTNSGRFGKGFDFSGASTSYISVPTTNLNNPTSKITISLWVLNNNFSNWNRLVSRDSWSSAGKYSWQLYESSNGRVVFGLSNGTSQSGPTSATNGIANGVWHHVVATYNGTTALIYINGSLAVSQTQNTNFTNIVFSPISYLYLGSSNSVNANSYLNGTVDELMIFNRTLTSSEVASLYSASANQYVNNFTGLSMGSHNLMGYAVDVYGNKNQTGAITVTLADTVAPSVTISSPLANATYPSSSISLNYTSIDNSALSSCWYSLNGGANTSFVGGCGNNATITAISGSNTVVVYSNDSFNNVGSASITFGVDLVNPKISFASSTSSGTLVADAINVNLTTSDANNHYSFVDFDNSLLGWWRGENTGNDDKGIYNASWVGTPMYGAGKFGSAFSFDRANGYVNTSHIFNQSTFSASVWFKANTLVNGTNILNNGYYSGNLGQGNKSWQLRLGWSAGDKVFFCMGNSTDNNCLGNSTNHAGIGGYLIPNAWYHVVVTYDGSNGNTSLYLNGLLNWTDSRPNMVVSTEAMTIGKDPADAANTIFNGLIDDVLIFNRTLTSAEVASLYSSGSSQYSRNFTGLSLRSYSLKGYAVDSAGNKNNTETRSVTLTVDSANTGLPSCLAQNCTEGAGCVITSDCHLDSSMCSGNLCQFTNLTLSAKLKTGTDASGNGKNLAINITSNASSPVLFLAGGAINFSGSSGTVGGNAGIVNITVYNLFNTTSAFFYGIGGDSSTSANGGNGGILQINAHGWIREFSDFDDSFELDTSNNPITNNWLAGGSSNGGNPGNTLSDSLDGLFNKIISVCPRDQDVDGNGHISQGDAVTIGSAYNDRSGDASYAAVKDINCDNNLNVIELSRIGLTYNTR